MTGTPGGTAERPCLFFSGPEEFRGWLVENHATADELWMGLNKKHIADRGLTWAEAVPEALCFGWIDSLSQPVDDDSRRQRWTPRRRGSNWSAVNIALVETLTAEGRMHPAGLAAFEARREDRSAIYSYETGEAELSPEYATRLAADPVASAWLAGAPPAYRRAAIGWVMNAKREATRESRLAALIDDSAHGRLIKPQRYGTEPAWTKRLRTDLGLH
ncbi:YdeI/OmpD-associated family protein [Propionibacteriaceae bacterium Y1700]|uniref:YdeI/OmpD-associated family protein n=1 Tax=Microlunatus sp. Y1700 TaxID=3418487 RepID=UPI003DA71DE6